MVRKSYWVLAALMPLGMGSVGAQQAQGNSPPQASSSGQASSPTVAIFPQQPVKSSAPAPNAPQSPSPQQPPANPLPPGYGAAPNYQPPPPPRPAAEYPQQPPNYQPPPNYPSSQGHVDDQVAPYHVHRDTRHGHDHVYPDRGSVVRDVPKGALVVNYAGLSYRFYEGTWFEPRGPAFMVVAPAIGLVVRTLPPFATEITSGGDSYLYANDVYYRPRPDIGGYEVVNDPAQGAAASAAPTAVPASSPAGSTGSPPVAAEGSPAVNMPAAATVPTQQVAASAPPAPPAGTPLSAPVAPTAPAVTGAAPSSLQPARVARVIAYPRNGQTAEQQARDQYECYRFAVAQTGFDPLRANGAMAVPQSSELQADFQRAQTACFDGRGYTSR